MEGLPKSSSLLNPLDRVAEILFGLIMALSFTCSISITSINRPEIRQLLFGVIGCNLAWGIVDAVMYLVGVFAVKNRNRIILEHIQNSSEPEKSRQQISDALPPAVASAIEPEVLEHIRRKLMHVQNSSGNFVLTFHDVKKSMALFFLVFISTLPVVLPFVFIEDSKLALRVSNLVAIVMMFLCGWSVGKYMGYSKWKMSLAMTLIGVTLVVITIALGG